MHKIKLGDVAKEFKDTYKGSKLGLPVVGLEHLTPQEMRIAAWDNDKDNTFTKMFHKGHVLFGRRRAYLKKAAFADFDGICSGDITVIEAIPGKIVPDLLPFIIQDDNFFDFAISKSAGSLSPRVKWEHLKEYEFMLPSIEVQKKLSEILWAFQDTKESYNQLLIATDALVKSQFIEMFGKCPKRRLTIRESCLVVADGDWIESKDQSESGLRLIQTGNVGEGVYLDKYAHAHYISEDTFSRLKCTEIYPGDILISRLPDPVGRACILPNIGLRMITAVDCTIIRVDPMVMTNDFFVAFTNSAEYISAIATHSRGATRTRISRKDLENIVMEVPPLELQKEFSEFIEQVDKSKFALQQNIENLEQFRNALMQKTFR